MGRTIDLSLTAALLLAVAVNVPTSHAAADEFNCEKPLEFPSSVCFITNCSEAIQGHIAAELDAAFSYLYLASYFDSSAIARPGLAKFLYGAASEEREHATMFLDYLNQRGIRNEATEYSFTNEVILRTWPNGTKQTFAGEFRKNPSYKKALELAIELEILVTKKIKDLIKDHCEDDFHAADYLTEPVLQEQHEGLRKLQGALQELNNMGGSVFHEYLLDRKLLEEGL